MQVHPCGQYRKNTVVGILQAEHDLAPVFRIRTLFPLLLLSLLVITTFLVLNTV